MAQPLRETVADTTPTDDRALPVLRLDHRPERLREWLGGLWRYRAVLIALARKDFRVRYKRASLGVIWAVCMPVLQAAVMAFVFSRVANFGNTEFNYSGYVLAGTVVWFYMSTSITSSTTAIVDASTLTDKVWFPRAVLTLVAPLANLVTLLISVVTLIVALPLVGASLTPDLWLLLPATALLVAFTASLGMLLGAADVYFRDMKFIVQALTLVWFYLTPIVYPVGALHSTGRWLYINPLTGITGLFQWAAVGSPMPSGSSLLVSIGSTVLLTVVSVGVHRRHDRLFVDLL